MNINVKAAAADLMPPAEDEARVLMRARRHLAGKQDDTFGIVEPSAIMELYNNLQVTCQRLHLRGRIFHGDRRHRNHEYHAGQCDGKNARNRRAKISGRYATRRADAIFG